MEINKIIIMECCSSRRKKLTMKVRKVRLKNTTKCIYFLILYLVCCVKNVFGNNHPPRFLIHGQTEIVLRLKEGKETPAGKEKLY